MNTDVSENTIPTEEPTEETTDKTQTEETTENPVENENDVLGDSTTDTENPEDVLETPPSTETGMETSAPVTETVSGSDVRTEEPVQTDSSESYAEVSGNDVYIIETTTEEPPFLTKPFSDYTTSEGLLLLIFILLLCSCLWSLINGK